MSLGTFVSCWNPGRHIIFASLGLSFAPGNNVKTLLFLLWETRHPVVSSRAGVPNPRGRNGPRPVRNQAQATQQYVSSGRASEASSVTPHRSHYCLNHRPPPPSMEKPSSTKPVPGAKKVGDHCPRVLCKP